MKRVLWLIIPVVAFFGCERDPVDGVDEDRAAIEALIGASAYMESTEHYGEEDTTDQKGEIDYISWWRGRPTSIERNISIDVVGDSAFAEINRAKDCSLHIIALDSIVDGVVHTTRYAKLFTDHGKRYAIFKRDTVPDHHRGWRLYALSGVDVESQPNTVQIDSVKIEWGDSVRMITDILRIETREEVLTVPPNQLIDLSVWTNDTTALLFLHFRRERRHRRRFRYSEGRFHRTFLAPAAGVRHIALGAMTRSTLYDSVEPYDSNTWLTVYRIE